MDNWKINLNTKDPRFPFIVIDNWYNEREEKVIWKELELYTALPNDLKDRAEKDGPVAMAADGTSKSKAFRFYVDQVYASGGKKYSPILNCASKILNPSLAPYISQCLPYSRHFFSASKIFTLCSYYEENDHYHNHFDCGQWTLLIWFVKDKELFTGGDFSLPESNNLIKLKHNRAVLFPGCCLHAVTPVKFKSPPEKEGLGRYTITHFINSEEDSGSNHISVKDLKEQK